MNVKGPVEVKTLYGNSGRTKDIFRDDRGMITTFDDDYPIVPGWGNPKFIESEPELALIGNYMRFSGEIKEGNTGAWGQMDADMTFHYWGEINGKPTGNLFPSDPKTSTLKFEVNVVRAWSALSMQFLFFGQGGTNGPMWSNDYPRGIWMPWAVKSGSETTVVPYMTDGWITVSIPLSAFNLDCQGEAGNPTFPTSFGALSIVVFRGGVPGLSCNPLILMDNIRVIP